MQAEHPNDHRLERFFCLDQILNYQRPVVEVLIWYRLAVSGFRCLSVQHFLHLNSLVSKTDASVIQNSLLLNKLKKKNLTSATHVHILTISSLVSGHADTEGMATISAKRSMYFPWFLSMCLLIEEPF